MKPSLPILALIAMAVAATKATDPVALIKLKAHAANYALGAAVSALQAKQKLVRSSATALINAKANFVQRQLPHIVKFKQNQYNAILELKKNLLRSKAAPIVQQAVDGGSVVLSAGQDVVPYIPAAAPPVTFDETYSPQPPQDQFSPAAPPAPFDQGYSPVSPQEQFSPAAPPASFDQVYSPPPQQEPLPPAAPPVEAPQGPYPPPSYVGKRLLTNRQGLPVTNTQGRSSFRPQQPPSPGSKYNRVPYSGIPTPPPQRPVRTIPYV